MWKELKDRKEGHLIKDCFLGNMDPKDSNDYN